MTASVRSDGVGKQQQGRHGAQDRAQEAHQGQPLAPGHSGPEEIEKDQAGQQGTDQATDQAVGGLPATPLGGDAPDGEEVNRPPQTADEFEQKQ
jgi:hypothetical protein